MTKGMSRLTRRIRHPMRKLASVARSEDELPAELGELPRVGNRHAKKGVLRKTGTSVEILHWKP